MRKYPAVDRCIIEAAQRGDEAAFAEIYRIFHNFILRYTAKSLREPLSVGNAYIEHRTGYDLAGAEDITQDAFLILFRKLHLFNPALPLAPWLCTIALNRCRRVVNRRPKGERSLECLHTEGDAVDDDRKKELIDARAFCDPLRLMGNEEIRELVAKALETLPERRRMVVSLRLIEEMDCDEIAAQMRITKPAAKSLLYHGMQEMREALSAVRTI